MPIHAPRTTAAAVMVHAQPSKRVRATPAILQRIATLSPAPRSTVAVVMEHALALTRAHATLDTTALTALDSAARPTAAATDTACASPTKPALATLDTLDHHANCKMRFIPTSRLSTLWLTTTSCGKARLRMRSSCRLTAMLCCMRQDRSCFGPRAHREATIISQCRAMAILSCTMATTMPSGQVARRTKALARITLLLPSTM